MLFRASSFFNDVSLGGQNLSCMAISNSLNSYGRSYTVYGADISAFAGQTETLAFSLASPGHGILDDIQFSPIAIPETSATSLLCLAAEFCFTSSNANTVRSKKAAKNVVQTPCLPGSRVILEPLFGRRDTVQTGGLEACPTL